MKRKYNSKIKIMGVLLSLAILVFPTVSAFANTFLENKTMHLYKGEIGKYCVYLQNTGDEDLVQSIRVLEGEVFIKNLNEITKEFNVLVGTVSDDLPVCMKVKLPSDAEKGEEYMVSYTITTPSATKGEGMVSFDPIQITEFFYLTEKLDKKPFSLFIITNITLWILLLLLILMSILAYRILLRRKQRTSKVKIWKEIRG